jgi:cysteine-rich repeat protein
MSVCGNGVMEPGEECDDGNQFDGDGCSAFCLVEAPQPVCGNGVVEAGEGCDDGNIIDGDGCSALCAVEQPPPDPNGLVPDTPHCAPVANVDPIWIKHEDETLQFTNEKRAQPQTCGIYGAFPACGPLTTEPHLRCAARLHSKDMAERNFFDHYNPEGLSPGDRMYAAGYTGGTWGENIYMGPTSAREAVDGWMASDGHCQNIMGASYTLLGVGYWELPGGWGTRQWTQNFGAAW